MSAVSYNYCSENGENRFLELGANERKFTKSVTSFSQPSTSYSQSYLLQAHHKRTRDHASAILFPSALCPSLEAGGVYLVVGGCEQGGQPA
jgi:hypothetical protein